MNVNAMTHSESDGEPEPTRGRGRGILIAALVGIGISSLLAAPPLGILLAERAEAKVGASSIPPAAADTLNATPAESATFAAVLLPPQMANLSPRAEGRIISVKARLGQTVKKGAVIVEFDLRERRHDLAIAEAQLRTARADAAAAATDLRGAKQRAERRNARLEHNGETLAIVSEEEQAQARLDADSARARVASSAARVAEQQARVDQLRVALEDGDIRAPFDGTITASNFEAGMTARPADSVVRLVAGAGLRVRMAVPEDAASALKTATSIRVEHEGQALSASIDQIANEVEPTTRAFIVEGRVRTPEAVCGTDCALLAGRGVRGALVGP